MQAILFLSFVLIVFFALRFILNVIVEARENSAAKRQSLQTKKTDSEIHAMVRCAHCSVHLPQSEAYFDGQHTYCSEGHMKLGVKTNQETSTPQSASDDSTKN